MKTVNMGLNTEPYFFKADEVIARFTASGNQSGVEMWERMRKDSETLRDEIAATVEADGKCELNWGCTGETLFNCLAYSWSKAMPQYRFEIGRYSCKVFKD